MENMAIKLTDQLKAALAPATALTEAQAKEKKTRLLERLGPTRDALKTILDFGEAVSEVSLICNKFKGSSEPRAFPLAPSCGEDSVWCLSISVEGK